MRRSELVAAVWGVLKAIERTEVFNTIDFAMQGRGEKTGKTARILDTAWKLAAEAQDFSEREHIVVDVLDLRQMFQPSWWVTVLEANDGREMHDAAWNVYRRLAMVRDDFPKLLRLIATEGDRLQEQFDSEPDKLSDHQIVRVVLYEDDGDRSKPQRIIDAIDAVSKLYAVAARLHDCEQNTLELISCDSGSDKQFDFLGVGPAISAVKDAILDLWDRVVFFRERQISAGMEVLGQSLEMIREIDALNGNGLGPEECEILKREVVEAGRKFIACGAVIPEMEQHATHSPRKLMRPEPKLLAAPHAGDSESKASDSAGTSDSAASARFDNLSPEEIEQLRSILHGAEEGAASKADDPED